MYMNCPKLKNGKTVVRLVVSFRQKGKKYPTNRTVKTIGQSDKPEEIEEFKSIARSIMADHKQGLIELPHLSREYKINIYDLIGNKRFNKGFEDVLGSVYQSLGFSKLLTQGRNPSALNEVLKYTVLMRAYHPSSKSSNSYQLGQYFNKEISLRKILFMMDRLYDDYDHLKTKIFESLLSLKKELKLLLFDVTTLYFESERADDLRDFGFSKDGKHGEVQIVLAVLSDEEGMPLTYEVFPGNVAETKTFSQVLEAFLAKHQVDHVSVIADRGMFSESNLSYLDGLNKDPDKNVNVEYIVSSPLKRFSLSLQKKIFTFKEDLLRQRENLKKQGTAELSTKVKFYELTHKGRRVVVSFSERHRMRDERKREEILEKLNKMTNAKGEISSHHVKKTRGVARYIKKHESQSPESGKVEKHGIDHKKIAEDSRWDGLYGVCTNKTTKAELIFENYRRLWKVEELFRINKHTLSMRPIYHWKARRIKAHILICFLAYAVLKYTESALKATGTSFSPQKIIDILKDVETYVIQDRTKISSPQYGVPTELSPEAAILYKALNIPYSTRPFKWK